jgi:hypothetical protein
MSDAKLRDRPALTPAMIQAGVTAFAHELPDAEETMRNAEAAALVSAIYRAMSAQVERCSGTV